MINDLIEGSRLALKETERLTWIFSEFFNVKGNNNGAIARDIIKDQIQNGPQGDSDEPMDQDYLKSQYSYEICLMFEELHSISDFEKLSPKHLGLDDDNFLLKELPRSEAEELKERFDAFQDTLKNPDSDWYTQILDIFEEIIQIVNTKILYLIYRQVKLVYTQRQK